MTKKEVLPEVLAESSRKVAVYIVVIITAFDQTLSKGVQLLNVSPGYSTYSASSSRMSVHYADSPRAGSVYNA